MSPHQYQDPQPHNVAILLHLCRLWDAQRKKSTKVQNPEGTHDLLVGGDPGTLSGVKCTQAGVKGTPISPAKPVQCAVVVVGHSHVFSMSSMDTKVCLKPSAPQLPSSSPQLISSPRIGCSSPPSPLVFPSAEKPHPSFATSAQEKEVSPKHQPMVAPKMQGLSVEKHKAEKQSKRQVSEDHFVDTLQSEAFDLLFSSFMDLAP
eukprot:GGOE01006526.1.p1 GENE.GGOE01006526.1~~GGOE01006526.1.p1  ORF type:complete len:211 (+),score=27.47 GGOE01006526.1:23-634(+)